METPATHRDDGSSSESTMGLAAHAPSTEEIEGLRPVTVHPGAVLRHELIPHVGQAGGGAVDDREPPGISGGSHVRGPHADRKIAEPIAVEVATPEHPPEHVSVLGLAQEARSAFGREPLTRLG